MNRVVVTGMGGITPLGNSADAFWDGIKNGRNGIAPITRFDASETGITVAGEVKDFEPSQYMDRKEYKRMDLYSQFAVAASVQAVEDSGIVMDDIDATRFGVIIGSGIGGLNEMESGIIKMHTKGPKRVPAMFVPMTIGNMAAGNTSIKVGAKGISLDIVTACASATNSIGEAYRNIKHGYSDLILAGGSEGTICEIGISGFAALTALSTSEDPDRASIPFDKDRNGFVMGEGAGVLMVESLEHAQKRGANILAEIVGYGSTSDAYHMTAPSSDGSGAGNAMKMAMAEAGITPDEVDYINAHGTSTPANDSSETLAIKYALGEEAAKKVAISSSKSMTGHLLGAAGGIESIVCVKAIQEGFVPPTIGLQNTDEACDLDYIPNTGRPKEVKYALNNSLGFGGHNAVLCFKKWEDK